jgi:hypothetical protein
MHPASGRPPRVEVRPVSHRFPTVPQLTPGTAGHAPADETLTCPSARATYPRAGGCMTRLRAVNIISREQLLPRPRVRGSVWGDRRVAQMILEVSEFHHPREPSRQSWRIGDPTHIYLVGLARSVPQHLKGLQLGPTEALGAQLPADGRTALEEVVQQGRGAGVRGDSGRDPLDVIDDRIAKAVALTYMALTSDCVREREFHGSSFKLSCTSICWRRRSS